MRLLSLSRLTLPVIVLASIGLVSCISGGGGGGSAGGGSGFLSLNITDAPVDFALEVVVQFDGVELHSAAGDLITITYNHPKVINLLALTGGVTEFLLEDESLPAGNYNWIRLQVDEANSYIDVGTGQEPLIIPSGAQTGLKLNRGFTVAANGSVAFTIDFDLRKSVHDAPGGGYHLRPTLRIVDDSVTGALAGSVDATLITSECAGADNGAVYVFEGAGAVPDDVDGDAGDPIATALVADDGSGDYSVAFLEQGDYVATYTCDAENDDPTEDDSLGFVGTTQVSITAGQTTTLDF